MSKQANPTVIGAFVVGGVVLIATAFALFGGSQIFAEKNRYVALFDEPTNGLRVGANVLLNGVRVGYVSDIDLIIDEVNFDTDTLVVLELLPEDIKTKSGQRLGEDLTARLDHDTLVNKAGLRAALKIESFVTGQLRVELQLRPETVAVMRAVDPLYPEIPTITSNIQELLNEVQSWFTDVRENVDIGGLSRRLNNVLQALDELARSEDLHQSLAGINHFINDQDMQQLGGQLKATLDELLTASAAASSLFDNANEGVDVLVANLEPVLERLAAVLEEAEQTLTVAKSQLKGDSEQLYRLGETLDELERAARSVREFFNYLERNPESMLRGKSE
jgi:paraquat-inducible protein B